MKAFLFEAYGIIARSHPEIEHQIDTRKKQTKVKEHIWKAYRNLRVESEKCRYNGFSSEGSWNTICKGDFLLNCMRLMEIVKYLKSKKIDIEIDESEIQKLFDSVK